MSSGDTDRTDIICDKGRGIYVDDRWSINQLISLSACILHYLHTHVTIQSSECVAVTSLSLSFSLLHSYHHPSLYHSTSLPLFLIFSASCLRWRLPSLTCNMIYLYPFNSPKRRLLFLLSTITKCNLMALSATVIRHYLNPRLPSHFLPDPDCLPQPHLNRISIAH